MLLPTSAPFNRPQDVSAKSMRWHWSKPKSFTVRTKITIGYGLAVSIPVMGALVGLIVGNYYEKVAIQALTTVYQEEKALNNLQIAILKNRPAKELSPFVQDKVAFRQASDQLLNRISDLQTLVTQLEVGETEAVRNFNPQLQSYQNTITRFSQDFQDLEQEIVALQASNNSALINQRILTFIGGASFNDLIQFADQINEVAIAVEQDILIAQNSLQQAEALRMRIILGSLVVAVLAAALLTIFTSQAIARPLESLTNVAQQVTRDINTNVRATVLTKDEVGELAHALNQLVEWVSTYTTELKETQLHLIQAEKMSSLGQLVAGVAHEINNPVNFIYGNITHIDRYTQDLLNVIQAYQDHYPNPPQTLQTIVDEAELDFIQEDLSKLLQSVQVGTDRIRQIVLSLRNFSRIDESEFKAVDLHEGIDNTLLILQHRLKARPECPTIEVVKNYAPLPEVDCYPGQLNQVFMNLLANAIDVLEDSAQQQIKTSQSVPPGQISISTQVVADQVRIEIADNGAGMSESVRSRIFDPFFTTKPIGKGTGLGLSISYQIVTEKHKGTIACNSILGQGTQFILEIPIRQPEPLPT